MVLIFYILHLICNAIQQFFGKFSNFLEILTFTLEITLFENQYTIRKLPYQKNHQKTRFAIVLCHLWNGFCLSTKRFFHDLLKLWWQKFLTEKRFSKIRYERFVRNVRKNKNLKNETSIFRDGAGKNYFVKFFWKLNIYR